MKTSLSLSEFSCPSITFNTILFQFSLFSILLKCDLRAISFFLNLMKFFHLNCEILFVSCIAGEFPVVVVRISICVRVYVSHKFQQKKRKTCSTLNLMIIYEWWLRILWKLVGNVGQFSAKKLQLFRWSCLFRTVFAADIVRSMLHIMHISHLYASFSYFWMAILIALVNLWYLRFLSLHLNWISFSVSFSVTTTTTTIVTRRDIEIQKFDENRNDKSQLTITNVLQEKIASNKVYFFIAEKGIAQLSHNGLFIAEYLLDINYTLGARLRQTTTTPFLISHTCTAHAPPLSLSHLFVCLALWLRAIVLNDLQFLRLSCKEIWDLMFSSVSVPIWVFCCFSLPL